MSKYCKRQVAKLPKYMLKKSARNKNKAGVVPDNVSPDKVCGYTEYGKRAARKCMGIQNMARGLPYSVSPLPYFVPPIFKYCLCAL